MLHPGDPNASPPILPTVAVVYPHQTNFGDFDETTGSLGGDDTRWFELRLVICSVDPATSAISSTLYPPLIASSGTDGLRYDGPADAAGIVLPDVAPASVPWRFGLAYEEQLRSSTVTSGRIQLQTWQLDPTSGGASLALLESHAFGSMATPAFRRRPILSSSPSAFPGQDAFAIAFNYGTTLGNGDVFYEEWDLTDGSHRLLWVPGWGWDNTTIEHVKPAPVLGRELSYQTWLGVCYAEQNNGGNNCTLLKYVRKDAATTDQLFTIATGAELQRPAAGYRYDGAQDTIALSWEQAAALSGGGTAVRIFLRFD